jgi:hypothetical protein
LNKDLLTIQITTDIAALGLIQILGEISVSLSKGSWDVPVNMDGIRITVRRPQPRGCFLIQ